MRMMFCIAQPVIVYTAVAFFIATLYCLLRSLFYDWELSKTLTSAQKQSAGNDRKTVLHFYLQGGAVGALLIIIWKFVVCSR